MTGNKNWQDRQDSSSNKQDQFGKNRDVDPTMSDNNQSGGSGTSGGSSGGTTGGQNQQKQNKQNINEDNNKTGSGSGSGSGSGGSSGGTTSQYGHQDIGGSERSRSDNLNRDD